MHIVNSTVDLTTLSPDAYVYEGSLSCISSECFVDLDSFPGYHSFKVLMIATGGASALSETKSISNCIHVAITPTNSQHFQFTVPAAGYSVRFYIQKDFETSQDNCLITNFTIVTSEIPDSIFNDAYPP